MDFKGSLAAFTVAALRVARAKVPLKRDLILLAEADEEGGDYGTGWLAKTAWAEDDAGVSLNEGGWVFEDGAETPRLMGADDDRQELTAGQPLEDARQLDPLLAPAARLRTRPPSRARWNRIASREPATPAPRRRHAALPPRPDRPRRRPHERASCATFLAATGRRGSTAPDGAPRSPRGNFGELFNGMLRTIYVPTIAEGGFRSNVLPGSAEATVNIRLLPGARPGRRSASSSA